VSAGYKFKRAIKPVATALPVLGPNVAALRKGGVKEVLDMNIANLGNWRPPDFNTINAYLGGTGGAAIMTTISAAFCKWLIKVVGFDGLGSLNLLIDAVQDGGEGAAVGAAIKEIIYPTASAAGSVGASMGGAFSFGALGAQPATGSEAEFSTKKDKPKSLVVFK
jgi:hypothetical protein